MGVLDKKYAYKITRGTKFLGELPNVVSEFTYTQDINTAGGQLEIDVEEKAETSHDTVTVWQDESGNTMTDESGNPIYIDRVPSVVGPDVETNMIQTGNLVEVVEFGDRYPNGKTVYQGYISSVEASFNDLDIVKMIVLPYSQEMDNILLQGTETTDVIQNTQNGFTVIYQGTGPVASTYGDVFQSFFISGGEDNISTITFKLAANNTASLNAHVICEFFDNSVNAQLRTGIPPNGSQTLQVTSLVATDYKFTFPAPITVTPGNRYYARLRMLDGSDDTSLGVNVYYQNTGPYAGGSLVTASFDPTFGLLLTNVGDAYFTTWYSNSLVTDIYTSQHPYDIVKDFMNTYISTGGRITYTSTSIDINVGEPTVSYTFKMNTVLEAIDICRQLSPSNWFWYVDVATKTLWFQELDVSVDSPGLDSVYWITLGRDIEALTVKTTTEDIVNVVYFSGGDDGSGHNVLVKVTDTVSLQTNPLGMARLSDTNVRDSATAITLASNYIEGHNTPDFVTTITIMDVNQDITLYQMGKLIGFHNFDNYLDSQVMQIVSIERHPEYIVLSLGANQPKQQYSVEDLQRSVIQLQTVDNPTAAS